jgi:hypothetical protein
MENARKISTTYDMSSIFRRTAAIPFYLPITTHFLTGFVL